MKSYRKRIIAKFRHAFDGLLHGVRHDRSIALQCFIALCVVIVGCCLPLTFGEWVVIIAMILMVISAEFFNSALEECCDKLFPQYDERAKKIKDYSAAAVLLLSILAALVGILVIGGKW